MTGEFKFDPQKSLDENFAAFLDHLAGDDEELAAILRANAPTLGRIVSTGERDASERTRFNSAVAAALDSLATSGPDRESS